MAFEDRPGMTVRKIEGDDPLAKRDGRLAARAAKRNDSRGATVLHFIRDEDSPTPGDVIGGGEDEEGGDDLDMTGFVTEIRPSGQRYANRDDEKLREAEVREHNLAVKRGRTLEAEAKRLEREEHIPQEERVRAFLSARLGERGLTLEQAAGSLATGKPSKAALETRAVLDRVVLELAHRYRPKEFVNSGFGRVLAEILGKNESTVSRLIDRAYALIPPKPLVEVEPGQSDQTKLIFVGEDRTPTWRVEIVGTPFRLYEADMDEHQRELRERARQADARERLAEFETPEEKRARRTKEHAERNEIIDAVVKEFGFPRLAVSMVERHGGRLLPNRREIERALDAAYERRAAEAVES